MPDIRERLAQYKPTPLTADLSALSPEDRQALDKLAEASGLMNEIFLRQVWTGNPGFAQKLAGQTGKDAEAARDYFRLNFGPWDRLAEMEPFVGTHPHPPGAGYYPEDLSKDEFEAWLAAHPEDREAFTSTFTVIRRNDGGLVAVPYSREYAEWLAPAARLLREAAGLTDNASLRRFLTSRADAFESNDYYASDLAWMDLDAPLEVTIGPYETYEDRLLGYKAAFEAYVTVDVPAESAALDRYKARLPWLETNLPIADRHKNLSRGGESPIRVVDVVLTAGDALAGVQTSAFNLPNDERVREAKGTKNVLLRNVMRAKYEGCLVPLAQRVLAPEDAQAVSFDAYFNEILHHELSHGLGPGTITVGDRKTEVRKELKELYSTLEEAKADVMGVYNILALIGEGDMPAALRRSLEPTYVAGLFRAARFGLDEAHGKGVVAQFTFLFSHGALEVDAEGRVRLVSARFPDVLRQLLHDILALQATGDYEGTRRFLDTYGRPPDVMRERIARLADLPVDIRPMYASPRL